MFLCCENTACNNYRTKINCIQSYHIHACCAAVVSYVSCVLDCVICKFASVCAYDVCVCVVRVRVCVCVLCVWVCVCVCVCCVCGCVCV